MLYPFLRFSSAAPVTCRVPVMLPSMVVMVLAELATSEVTKCMPASCAFYLWSCWRVVMFSSTSHELGLASCACDTPFSPRNALSRFSTWRNILLLAKSGPKATCPLRHLSLITPTCANLLRLGTALPPYLVCVPAIVHTFLSVHYTKRDSMTGPVPELFFRLLQCMTTWTTLDNASVKEVNTLNDWLPVNCMHLVPSYLF